MGKLTDEATCLIEGIARIGGVLERTGVKFEFDQAGRGSGSSNAVGYLNLQELRIGLIVRRRVELGSPIYIVGEFGAGHADVILGLGAGGTERLISQAWQKWVARDGSDVFDALGHDLEKIIVPAYVASPIIFRAVIAGARSRFRATGM